jgi:hypothetical protein
MKEIFVLGAGASTASAGTPLGLGLVWEYPCDCGLFVPVINGQPDTSDEDIRFANYRKFLVLAGEVYPELRKETARWDNRGLYCYHFPYQDKKYYVDEILRIVQERRYVEGTELTRQLILEHIAGTCLGKPNQLYKQFVSELLRRRPSKSVSVISFNFDTLLREEPQMGVYFDYLLDFDCINPNRRYRERASIPLIKLNGSLDWGICRDCGRLHLLSPHIRPTSFEQMTCVAGCDGRIDPFIIMPHQEYGERIQRLWDSANAALKQAEKITVIGYSFPEYDHKVIALFRDSMQRNVKIEVVDYCESEDHIPLRTSQIRKRYSTMFPGIDGIEIMMDGFDGYMERYCHTV